jgi:hypothetical protein
MITAGMSDGLAGARAVVALAAKLRGRDEPLRFAAVADQWPEIEQYLASSHLVVIGSPEVNACATFLHGIVEGFFFGERLWAPELFHMADCLYLLGRRYDRAPHGNTLNHCGIVILLRNPWNPQYRLLWIAGLSGHGTNHGSTFVTTDWDGYRDEADTSIGLVYEARTSSTEGAVPLAWLRCKNGRAKWELTAKGVRAAATIPTAESRVTPFGEGEVITP